MSKRGGDKAGRSGGRWRRRLLLAFGLLLLLLVVAAVIVVRCVSMRLERIATAALERQFPFDTQIERASLAWPGEVTLEGVTMRRRTDGSRVARIRRVRTSADLRELLAARIHPRSLVVEGVELTVRETDPELFEKRPEARLPDYPIVVRGLTLDLLRGDGGAGRSWVRFADAALSLAPQGADCLAVTGSGDTHAFRPFRVRGVLGSRGMASHLTVLFPRVVLDERVRAVLPEETAGVWDRLAPSGTASLTAELTLPRDPAAAEEPFELSWRLALRDGSVTPFGLPSPVRKVDAIIEGTRHAVRVTEATGMYRSALLSFAGHSLRHEGQPAFRLSGKLRGVEPTPEIIGLFNERTRRAIQDLALEGGRVDMDVESRFVIIDAEPGRPPALPYFLRADVRLRDCTVKPTRFPYRLTRLTGAFTTSLDDMVITSPLVGWHKGGTVRVSGRVGFTDAAGGSELFVSASGLPIDPDLEHALKTFAPATYKKLQGYGIRGGELGVTLDFKGYFGPHPENDWTVRAVVEGTEITPEVFPLRLADVSGQVQFRPGLVSWDGVTGRHGTGTVTLSGKADLSGKGNSELFVRARDLAIDETLERALAKLDPQVSRWWTWYGIEGGRLHAEIRFRGAFEPAPGNDWFAAVSLDNATMVHKAFPYEVTDLGGLLRMRPGRVELARISGRHDETPITIDGWANTRDKTFRISIRGTDVKLDEDLTAAMPEGGRARWRELRTAGSADLDVTISTPSRKGVPCDMRVAARLNGCSARFPLGDRWLPMTDLRGTVVASGDTYRFSKLSGKCLGGSLTGADGLLIVTDTMTKLQGELAGDNFLLPEIIARLPAASAESLAPLEPSGRVAVRNGEFDLIRPAGGEPDLEYACTVELRDVGISIPFGRGEAEGGERVSRFPVSEVNGRLMLSRPRGRVSTGSFALDRLRVSGGLVHNLTGDMEKAGPVLSLQNVRGEMHGGRLKGEFSAASDLSFFHGHASASGMDVARINAAADITRARIWGKMRASVQVNGWRRPGRDGGRPLWRRSGSGSIDIDRANLGETGLVRSIYDVPAMFTEGGSTVESASLDFLIGTDRIHVQKLVFSGPRLSTRGVGEIHYVDGGQLDLYFYREAHGSLLPNLPIVYWVGKGLNKALDLIQNELVVVRVSGTLSEPSVSGAVLQNMEERLQRSIVADVLLGAGETKEKTSKDAAP
ncbi:MAG: hypothetical protein ACOC8E_04860 [Planctomycetota bacterium]